ncbi:hypothetical protein G5B30_16785 [Sphingobacterium sp. SGG-5]|nr:hypothetical protein [Sphingobacterium sp. SGG-5]
MRNITLILLLCACFVTQNLAQPCFPGQIVTATMATGGSSVNKERVLWLTWGSTDQTAYPYGRHNRALSEGDKSYASILLGSGQYLCIEAEITEISGGAVNSYAPGNYAGDSMDDLYNIGGTGGDNQLVAGIINRHDGDESIVTFKCKATISGKPIRISGLVVADAESLAVSEYIYATADGNWNLVEVQKKTSNSNPYDVRKEDSASGQTIQFLRGNDDNTAAIAFLSFNPSAYNTAGTNPDLSVTFQATLKGNGLTALAMGLLVPDMDFGDAPESYGNPIHLLHNITFTDDGIDAVPEASDPDDGVININTVDYTPGSLIPTEGRYLGSVAPDHDGSLMHSKDALGDNNSGTAGTDEEDAWPIQYRRFSYKEYYLPHMQIQAQIAFGNGEVGDRISGWIDFDLNGTFDNDEISTAQITTTDINNGYVTLTWTVPPTRRIYNTYVRLRYFDKTEDYSLPDHAVNYGEVEDHRMYVLGPGVTNPTLLNRPKN